MMAKMNEENGRSLAAGAKTDVFISYDVVTSTKEVGARTPQAAFNAVKSKLESAVSNQNFANAIASAATAHGVTGLEGVTTTTILVSKYNVLTPTASPTSGEMGASTSAQGSASSSTSDSLTVGLAVGLAVAVVILGALAYRNWSRSVPKDIIPNQRKEVAMTGARQGKAYATHDFDAETDSSTVSPMAAAGRTLRDSIPLASDPRVSVTSKRL